MHPCVMLNSVVWGVFLFIEVLSCWFLFSILPLYNGHLSTRYDCVTFCPSSTGLPTTAHYHCVRPTQAPEQRSSFPSLGSLSLLLSRCFCWLGLCSAHTCPHGPQSCGPHTHWTDGLLAWCCAGFNSTLGQKHWTLALLLSSAGSPAARFPGLA